MKSTLIACLCAASVAVLMQAGCASTSTARAASAPAASVLEDVARVDRQRLASSVAADIPALRQLFASDLTYCHSNGSCESGASLLQRIGSGELHYLKLEGKALQPELAGSAVLVHGKVDMQAQNGPQTVSMALSYLAVYEKRDGRWQLRAYQSTRIP